MNWSRILKSIEIFLISLTSLSVTHAQTTTPKNQEPNPNWQTTPATKSPKLPNSTPPKIRDAESTNSNVKKTKIPGTQMMGGRTSGGGENTVSPEYLRIAAKLAQGLKSLSFATAKDKIASTQKLDIANRIEVILKDGLSVHPTNQPLYYVDRQSPKPEPFPVDALTHIGERITLIYSPVYERSSCDSRYALGLHEFLVHEKMEKSLERNVSGPLWDELKVAVKTGLIHTDFSCELPTLENKHTQFTVAVVSNTKMGRISIECMDSDSAARCSTYQFFFTPWQQDLKTPIGGRVYGVQELSKLSVMSWFEERWKDVPLVVIEDIRLVFGMNAQIMGDGLGLQFIIIDRRLEKLLDKVRSQKAERVLKSMTEIEVLQAAEGIPYRQLNAKKKVFQKLVDYIAHEGSFDVEALMDLNQGIRILDRELPNLVCVTFQIKTVDLEYYWKTEKTRRIMKSRHLCGIVEYVGADKFRIGKPQAANKAGKPSMEGFLANSGRHKRRICKYFGESLGINAPYPNVKSRVSSKIFHASDDQQMGMTVGGTSKVIGTLECSASRF
jgi:hypothetical protein